MIISLWAQILRKVPGSRMILKDPKLEDQAVRREVGVLFKDAGIELDRIEFRGLVPTRYDHLRCYDDIDIALDTFPYHGTTTTCEALWMGVPVVTRAGDTHVSRVGVSLLRSVGLSGFISHTDDEYVNTTVMLACDEERRLYLRKGLRLMMARSPLMDYAGVARELEEAFMAMLTSCPEKRRS
jgi:predicted O-linked N-acetylglucosamine transferase (SPINDLY family)